MATPDSHAVRHDYATGYFGVPGESGARSTKVHAVKRGTGRGRHKVTSICGARLGPKAEFAWCAWGIYLDYVECRSCKRMAHDVRARELSKKADALGYKLVKKRGRAA